MKKLVLMILLVLATVDVIAQTELVQNPYLYNYNYLVSGYGDESARFQLSLKYHFMKEYKTGLHFTYTQTSAWDVTDKQGSVFSNSIFSPGIFLEMKSGSNFFGDMSFGVFDFFRVGVLGRSNGYDGKEERGYNSIYGEILLKNHCDYEFGFDLKGIGLISIADENSDIRDYMGYIETEVYFQINKSRRFGGDRIYIRGGGCPKTKHGWIESGLMIKTFDCFEPYFFIQGYYGYMHDLSDYNTCEKAIRVGLLLK